MPWLIAAGIYLYTSCSHEETFTLKNVFYQSGEGTMCLYEHSGKQLVLPRPAGGYSCESRITVCLDKK